MGEQRQRFSFRLPWSAPSAPARRPANVTNSPSRATSSHNNPKANPTNNSQTPKAHRQAPTLTKTGSKPTTTESPNVRPQTAIDTQYPAPTSIPPNHPSGEVQNPSVTTPQPILQADQKSSLRSSGKVGEQNSPPQAQASPKIESQPSSPSPAGFQSRTSSQTASQFRAGTQRRATSQYPPPSNTSPRYRSPSQPPVPSRASIMSKNGSQSSLISHPKSPQSEADSQPSSPARSQHKSLPSAVYEPRQTRSPTKILNPTESSLPSPTSSKPPLPLSQNKNRAVSQPQPLETYSEKNITDDIISKAPIESTVKPIATAPVPSQESDPTSTIPTPMVAEEMTDEYKELSNSNTPIFDFQKWEWNKQSKTMASHPSNKNMVGNVSRQKPTASNREGVSMQKEIKNDISMLTHKMTTEQQGKPVSVITLVGENKGAIMQLGSKREAAVHIHRGYKLNHDESAEATTDGDKSSKDKRPKEANTKEDQITKAYMNSNSQGMNNSIVFNSSITERNPGVHLNLTQNRIEPVKTNSKVKQLEAHKAETSITPSQKLTDRTTIRRRCLRGLFMESSDSDPDNPEKPHRHGCRCSYSDMNKDKEIDLL